MSKAEPTLCLKCGSQISHIPYRYNGQVFHARCLLCNSCGRRLIGKPFITQNRQIFCGDKCQEDFAKGRISKPLPNYNQREDKEENSSINSPDKKNYLPPHLIDSGTIHNTEGTMSARLAPPIHYRLSPTMSRMTDYPVRSPPALVRHSHSIQSETDSLSTLSETISESSFTSDSSYAYDAQRKPKKKILKSSNAPRKRHKNRVRFHLQDNVSDSTDSQSLDSSSSFGGGGRHYLPPHLINVHSKTRETTMRTLANWRDYERPLPPGSTGLTPSRVRGLSHSYQLLNSPEQVVFPRQYQDKLYRTYSGDVHSPSHPMMLQRNFSTPISVQDSGHAHPIINVPILHLDEGEVPELEQSGMEERLRRRLYRFPEKPRKNLNDDDANDYDHLKPKDEPRPSTQPHSQPVEPRPSDQPRPPQSTENWYSDEDIDEALEIISMDEGEEEGSGDNGSPPPVPAKKNKSPPTPPKRVSSLPTATTSSESLQQSATSVILSPPPEFKSTPSDNPLHSPSMETLKNYDSTSPSSQPLDDVLTPEVHPDHAHQPLPSWGSPLKDRIVEGAEDPHRNPSPVHPPNQSDMPLSNGLGHLLETSTKNGSISHAAQVTRHSSLSPKRRDNVVSKLQSNSTHCLTTNGLDLSKEEEKMIQWYRSPQKMKPIIVDTDKEIEQMIAEITTAKKHRHGSMQSSSSSLSSNAATSSSSQLKHCGTCCACNKSIDSPQSLFSFASRLYHTKCFCCAQCGCPLRGKQIYTLKGTLVCPEDYEKITTSGHTYSLPATALRKDTTKAPPTKAPPPTISNNNVIRRSGRFFPRFNKHSNNRTSSTTTMV